MEDFESLVNVTVDPAPSFNGYLMEHGLTTAYVLKKIVDDNPDILRIVELGTGHGGTSLLFGFCIHQRNGMILTIDITNIIGQSSEKYAHAKKRVPWSSLAKKYNVRFWKADVFHQETLKGVHDFIKDHRALIFCDNGDKKREFPLYSSILKKDDLILAHDFSSHPLAEFQAKHLTKETLSILEPYKQKEFDDAGTKILSMKRK